MSETKELNYFLEKVIDYRGKTPPKSKHGIPLISAANVKKGRVILDGKFISKEVYEKWTTRGFIKQGDVLLEFRLRTINLKFPPYRCTAPRSSLIP